MIFRTQPFSSKKRVPGNLVVERKATRFRRLIDTHTDILETIADLEEKQSGEYILDRHYIEAQIDRVCDGLRQIIYDSNVICESDGEQDYARLAGYRRALEDVLKRVEREDTEGAAIRGEDPGGWEVRAVRSIRWMLTRRNSPSSAPEQGLAETAGELHQRTAAWLSAAFPLLPSCALSCFCISGQDTPGIEVFALGEIPSLELNGNWPALLESLISGDPARAPLSYFAQGLAEGLRPLGRSLSPSRGRPGGKGPRPHENQDLRLYAGGPYFLLWFPPSRPLRLLLCGLSPAPSENLLYLYGSSGPDPLRGPPWSFLPQRNTVFPTYGYRDSDGWIIWAERFSWVQGEERLRLLGYMLGASLLLQGGPASRESPEAIIERVGDVFSLPSKECCDDGRATSSNNGCR